MPPVEKRPSEDRKKLGDGAEVVARVTEMEEQLAALRAKYEQYFMGVERKPPNDDHDAFKRQLAELRGTFVRHTGAKFRVQGLQNKYLTYERLWVRTLKEIESGTYKRDLFKARRSKQAEPAKKKAAAAPNPEATPPEDNPLGAHPEDAPAPLPPLPDAVSAALKAGAAVGARQGTAAPGKPGITAAGARQPSAPVAAEGGLSENKIKAIYDAYVMAKKRCNEDTSKLSVDSLASTLRKQVPELMKQHGAKSVEFKVVIKDGKAILRALPKA